MVETSTTGPFMCPQIHFYASSAFKATVEFLLQYHKWPQGEKCKQVWVPTAFTSKLYIHVKNKEGWIGLLVLWVVACEQFFTVDQPPPLAPFQHARRKQLAHAEQKQIHMVTSIWTRNYISNTSESSLAHMLSRTVWSVAQPRFQASYSVLVFFGERGLAGRWHEQTVSHVRWILALLHIFSFSFKTFGSKWGAFFLSCVSLIYQQCWEAGLMVTLYFHMTLEETVFVRLLNNM